MNNGIRTGIMIGKGVIMKNVVVTLMFAALILPAACLADRTFIMQNKLNVPSIVCCGMAFQTT